MTLRLSMTNIPEPKVDRDAGVEGLPEVVRVCNQNFRQIRDLLERAITGGTLFPPGSITSDLLSTSARTLVGDVTGLIGASADGGATLVEKIRGVPIAAPTVTEDAKAIVYNHAGLAWAYADVLRDVLTTRGDLLVRGASAETRLGIGAANTMLKSDGTDPSWATLTSMLDALFSSSQGAILYRGSSAWAALAPGTSGNFLKTQGAGADPVWDSASAGSGHALLSSTHTDTTAASVTRGDLITGQGASPTWSRLALGASGKFLQSDGTDAYWGDPPAGSNHNLLSSTHSDTTADTVVRGDLITGQGGTPTWKRLAKGANEAYLMGDGTDPAWRLGAARYYPMRGIVVYNAQNAGNAVGDGGGVRTGITVLGTRADGGDTVRYCNKYTSATTPSGSQAGPGGLVTATIPQPRHYLAFRCDFKIVTSTNGVFWAGITSANLNAADPTAHLAALRFLDGTDTNFRCCTKDGSTLNNEDSGVAKDANWHDLWIETPDAGVTYNFYLDGVFVKACTAHVPTTTQAVGCIVAITILSTGTADEIRNSYIRLISGPHLFA